MPLYDTVLDTFVCCQLRVHQIIAIVHMILRSCVARLQRNIGGCARNKKAARGTRLFSNLK
jgi:hypothetical protein